MARSRPRMTKKTCRREVRPKRALKADSRERQSFAFTLDAPQLSIPWRRKLARFSVLPLYLRADHLQRFLYRRHTHFMTANIAQRQHLVQHRPVFSGAGQMHSADRLHW